MRRFFRVHMPFARAGLQSSLAYRTHFIFYVLGDVLNCFIMFFLWVSVFNSSGEGVLHGFTTIDMVCYIFVSFLTSYISHSSGAWEMTEEIRDGSIAMRLIKPIDFERPYLFFELGDKIMAIYIVVVPAIIGIEIYRAVLMGGVQFSVVTFLLYVVSVTCGYLINFYFGLCFGFMAFLTKYMWGLNMVKSCISGFLSGGMIPLNFLPAAAFNVLQILPFASLTYIPTMIYMGKYNLSESLGFILLQLFWVFFFYVVSKIIWHFVKNHLTVQGG